MPPGPLSKLLGHGLVVAPGAYDARTALLVQRAGFSAIYLGGSAISCTQLARPDLGPVGYADVVERVRLIRDRVEDQAWPRGCGHLDGRRVEPASVKVAKVQAAVDGAVLRGWPVATISREQVVGRDGVPTGRARLGQFVRRGGVAEVPLRGAT